MQRFVYVGPEEVRARWADQPPGRPVRSSADVRAWVAAGQSRDADGRFVATFVVDDEGRLRIEDYGYEHVACAGGKPVLAAGVVWFGDDDGLAVEAISNQSTGFCPDPCCWPAVARALDDAGLPHPGRFTETFVFRRCPECGERNLVKDDWFVCGLCDAPLPAHWNFV
ncbi:MAG: hypothetical protein AAF602_05890 [Myxococcota bacterium]